MLDNGGAGGRDAGAAQDGAGAGDSGPAIFDPDSDPAGAIPAPGDGAITLSGGAQSGQVDGPREQARFNNPVNVVLGPDNNLYVADTDNGLIRVVRPSGMVHTLTRQENFSHPFGMAFGPDGTLYVQTDANDMGGRNNDTGTLWRVDRRTGAATVLVRDIGRPRSLLALADGTLVMADNRHHVVRRFNPTTLEVTELAGALDQPGYVDGARDAARFDEPCNLVLVGDRIILADQNNHRLRTITMTGEVGTFAGSGEGTTRDGQDTAAAFNRPQGLAVDRDGNVFVTELSGYRVRHVTPQGLVTTVAGTGRAGFADGEPMQAEFFGLEGIDVSADGKVIYLADGNRGGMDPYHRIRRVMLPN